jgi:O-antigen ligase
MGYCFFLFAIPSQLIVRQLGAPGTPANLLGLASLLWWLCATVGGMNPGQRLSPTRLTVALLSSCVLASYAVGTANGWSSPADIRQATDELWTLVPVSLTELNDKMSLAANRGILSFGGWIGIVLLTADGIRSWRELERLVTWICWLGAFVAALGILQFFTGIDIAALFRIPGLSPNSDFGAVATRSVVHRVSSTAVHPIEFGVVLAGLFPLALHRTIFGTRSWRCWLPVLAIGVAIPMAVSRSGILVLGIVLLVMFMGWPMKWRGRAIVIAPLAAFILRALIPGLLGTISALFINLFNDPSVTGRTQDYGVVFRLYHEHIWLGRGLFTFVPRYYRILDNQFLMYLVELGAIGLTMALTFFVCAFFTARGARRRAVCPRHQHLALAMSASLAGVVLSYATFDAWSFPMAAGLTFLLIGMIGAAWQIAVREQASLRQQVAQPRQPALDHGTRESVDA